MNLIEVGYGTSRADDSYECGVLAAKQARSGIKNYDISVVLVFASIRYDLQRLLAGIASVMGDAPLAGITTAGEICNGVHEGSVVVTALASPYLQVEMGLGRNVSRNWAAAVDEALSAEGLCDFFSEAKDDTWSELTRKGENVFGMLFSPGNTQQSNCCGFEILEKIKGLSNDRFPIIGGCAADDWRMDTNFVLCGTEAHPDSLLFVLFRTRLAFGMAMSHGFKPTSRRATVTRCQGHEVIELDGRPAADVYAELVEMERNELEGKHLTLLTQKPCGTADAFGQYSVNVASFITPQGGIRMTQPVVQGAVLIVMAADSDEIIEAAPTAARKALWRAHIAQPSLILAFSCALRPRILRRRTSEEIEALQAILPNAPLVGCYSFGEQGLADDALLRHNNLVIALLALGNELSQPAKTADENSRLLIENLRITDALRAKTDEQSLLLDNIETQIWYLTDINTYANLNKAHADFLGISVSRAAGKKLDEFLPPDVAQVCRESNMELFRTRQSVYAEEWVPNGQGERRLLAIRKTPKMDDAGNIAYVVCVADDITEQRQGEQLIRTQAQILSNVQDGLFIISRDMKLQYANRTAEALFGMSSEILHQPCYKVLRGREQVCDSCSAVEVFKDQLSHQDISHMPDSSGYGNWFFSRAFPYYDAKGELIGAIKVISDFSDAKRAQDQLAMQGQRLELALDSGRMGMWDWDISTGTFAFNKQWFRMLDRDPGLSLTSNDLSGMVHPDDLPLIKEALQPHLDGKSPFFEVEHRLLTGKNEWKWILSKGKVVQRDSNNHPLRMMGTNLDNSEAHQLMDLSNAQRDLAIALSSSTDLLDALNRVIETICNLGIADCGGVYLRDDGDGGLNLIVHRGLSSEFVENAQRLGSDSPQVSLALSGKPVYRIYQELFPEAKSATTGEELRAIAVIPVLHNSRVIAVLNVASHSHDEIPIPFRNALEMIAAQLGGAIARIKTGERLREFRQNLETLFSSLQDFVFVIDEQGKIIFTNPVAEHRLEYAAGELIGQSVHQIHPPNRREEAEQIISDMLAGTREFCPIPLHTKSGNSIPVETRIVRAQWSGQPAILGISRDISERLKGENDRLDLERKLFQVQKSESLGRMAAAIAHHFNNMLSVVLGNLELALEDVPNLPGLKDHLKEAMKASHRAADVSRSMLVYLGQASGEVDPIDLAAIIRDALVLPSEAISKKVRITTEIPFPGPTIVADPGHIRQIITNLVMNAGEAIGDQDGAIRISLRTIQAEKLQGARLFPADWKPSEERYISLAVEDTGCGLDPAIVGSVFDPFFSTKFVGRGLGLSLVLGVVRRYRGGISIDSKLGFGTTFRIFLPVSGLEAPPIEDSPSPLVAAGPLEGIVLVAEDEESVRNLTCSIVERLGYKVLSAIDGVEAVNLFREHKDTITCVLLDLSMPRMDGWEVLSAIRKIRPEIPVVLASGYAMAQIGKEGRAELPQVFLSKPYRKSELREALSAARRQAFGSNWKLN